METYKMITKEDFRKAGAWEEVIKDVVLPMRIDEEIYNYFFDNLPPLEIGKTRYEFINISLPIRSYFLAGEATCSVGGQLVYNTFAEALDKYWYLGEFPKS